MRYQKIRFGQIKSDPAQLSTRHKKILDNQFGHQRKLKDEQLKEITNLKPVKSDSTSLSHYVATILGFVNELEQNSCAVTNASEELLVIPATIKIRSKDNVEFGREMHRIKKEESV